MKEDFTKQATEIFLKAVYSKIIIFLLSKIHVEFIILKRNYMKMLNINKLIFFFKPPAYQENLRQVIKESREFVEYCFTKEGYVDVVTLNNRERIKPIVNGC